MVNPSPLNREQLIYSTCIVTSICIYSTCIVTSICIYSTCIVTSICIYSTCIVTSIIESVDSISRDERDVPLTQYITNA